MTELPKPPEKPSPIVPGIIGGVAVAAGLIGGQIAASWGITGISQTLIAALFGGITGGIGGGLTVLFKKRPKQ